MSQRWAGIMDCSNDGKPVVGPMPGKPNQWVVAGFNGHGMPVGLGVGKEVSRGIATEAVPATLAPFNPERFEELV
ncbi:MAG TPA: FAD-dependent oxidoreductase [Pyrinomonadaceae bacterium]|nr:FAD-dependent oxidoreductase [Pyrinomonadaceae bacterium]